MAEVGVLIFMKVLMYGWEFPPNFTGGLGIACYGIVHGLLANHVEVALVLPKDPARPAYDSDVFVLEHNLKLVSIDSSLLSVATINSLLQPYMTTKQYEEQLATALACLDEPLDYGDHLLAEVKRYAAAAGKQAAKIEHDVIHAHDWLTILAGIKARQISGKPLIFQIHALETDRSGEHLNQAIYDIERYGLHVADHIISVSHYTKNKIIERYGIAADKITVVHNGLFRQKRCKVERRFSVDHQLKTVLFLGRLTFQKGVFYFIEAARQILAQRQDIQFVIAGEGDLLVSAIERVAALRLGAHIHFTHFLDRAAVSNIYSLSDAYVMPSVSEPFGIACLEALEHHVPVIISKQSGVAEVLDCIITADFWDTDVLAQQILNVVDYPQLTNTLLAGIDEKLDQLTWNNLTKQMIDVYEGVNIA